MQTFKIDPVTGMYIHDVVHPDTVWVPSVDEEGVPTLVEKPFPVPADEVTVSVPGGFWHPKWDGSKWVEGLSNAEIAARKPKVPSYETFIMALSNNASPMKALLKTTTDQLALMAVITELHNPEPRFNILKVHWDNVIEGLPEPLTAAQKAGFAGLAASANLNMSLDETGKLVKIST
ncbi:MAG: hypothetical protein RBJ76_13645 [Stenomitos frigidus ULC029]